MAGHKVFEEEAMRAQEDEGTAGEEYYGNEGDDSYQQRNQG